jgi:hypothetical protein
LPALAPLVLFVVAVALWRRRPVPRPALGGRRMPPDGRLVRHVGGTVVGGYLAFLLIVVAFETGIGDDPIAEAAVGGAALAVAAGVAFVVLSGLEALVRSRSC